jgi:hypothetical protein
MQFLITTLRDFAQKNQEQSIKREISIMWYLICAKLLIEVATLYCVKKIDKSCAGIYRRLHFAADQEIGASDFAPSDQDIVKYSHCANLILSASTNFGSFLKIVLI